MESYFLVRGCPETSLDNDLRRVSIVPRDDALTPPSHRNDNAGNRVPLVLTYNPFNTDTKRILLDNFDILPLIVRHAGFSPSSPLYRIDGTKT